jgi:hypothetical protein
LLLLSIGKVLVADISSNFLTRPIDVSKVRLRADAWGLLAAVRLRQYHVPAVGCTDSSASSLLGSKRTQAPQASPS